MANPPTIPGSPFILARLPAQDWFTLDEVAALAGWSRSFVKDRVNRGIITAQKFQRAEQPGNPRRAHFTYRIHVDDLVIFIITHPSGRHPDEKPFGDILGIVRTWPRWMARELWKVLERIVHESPPAATATAAGVEPQEAD